MRASRGPYTSSVSLTHYFELIGFVLGLLFGSFLNVCIARLPSHQSIVQPRSHCMACGRTIGWYDNLPLVSWLLLRARCRECKAAISWRYPAVELAVGIWFAVCVNRAVVAMGNASSAMGHASSAIGNASSLTTVYGSGGAVLATDAVAALSMAILGFLLIGLMVMDWQTQRLPDAFTITGIVVGFALACVQAFLLVPGGSYIFLTGTGALLLERLVAIAGAALLLLAIRWLYKVLRRRDGMGLGDAKMLAMIAAFLGFSEALLALFIAVVAASVYGLALLASRRASSSTRLPLGSFLAAGGLFAALFGPRIVGWYIGLLR